MDKLKLVSNKTQVQQFAMLQKEICSTFKKMNPGMQEEFLTAFKQVSIAMKHRAESEYNQ